MSKKKPVVTLKRIYVEKNTEEDTLSIDEFEEKFLEALYQFYTYVRK